MNITELQDTILRRVLRNFDNIDTDEQTGDNESYSAKVADLADDAVNQRLVDTIDIGTELFWAVIRTLIVLVDDDPRTHYTPEILVQKTRNKLMEVFCDSCDIDSPFPCTIDYLDWIYELINDTWKEELE